MMLMTSLIASLASPAFFTSSLYALQNTTKAIGESVNRLSTGNRILSAGDDIASLSIALGLQSQLAGFKQGTRNAAQAGSLLQVAEGGLTQINELLDSLKALAVQANSSSLTDADRGFLQQQFTEYLDEIDRIAENTSFNDINLLDGTLEDDGKDFRIGSGDEGVINVVINNVETSELFDDTPDITSEGNAADAQEAIEEAIDTVLTELSTVGALQERFITAGDAIDSAIIGVAAANSSLVDTDIAAESTQVALQTVRMNAAVAVLAQAQNIQSSLLGTLRLNRENG